MKRTVLFLLTLGLFCFAGCSKNNPKEVVKSYYTALQDKDYSEAVSYFANVKDVDDVKALEEKLATSLEESGGIKSFNVLGDSITSDTTAFVYTTYTLGNGVSDSTKITAKLEDGNWKIDPLSK